MRIRESPMDDILHHLAQRKGLFRFAAIMICVCLSAAFALFAVSVLAHANHGHDHDGVGSRCLVCERIATVQNLFWWFNPLAWCALFLSCTALIEFCSLRAALAWAYFQTLIALKVPQNR